MTNKKHRIPQLRHGARRVRWCLGIVVTIGSAACAPSPEPTHQTVDYYRTNRDAREAKLAECANDPGALGQTPDCINARQAARLDVKSLRDLAPLDLPGAAPDDGRSDADSAPVGAESTPRVAR